MQPGCSARARRSGGARRDRGSTVAARHTPTEEHAPKHALILLAAASPLCQVNGWASDSGLYIPTVPSLVKPCSCAAYIVITTPTATILNTENASARKIDRALIE